MEKITENLRGHKKYFMASLVFMILMMTLIIFSQLAMEIYAYNFIVKTNITKNINSHIVNNREQKDKNTKMTGEETTTIQEAEKVDSPVISFIKPIKGGVTTSKFGDKADRLSAHMGHDWAVNTGTKVMAAADGIVEKAYYSDSYGYNVLIMHGNGLETRYAHLSSLSVTSGQKVKKKQIIGLSGTTGNSTGPHLHFEVIKYGEKVNPLKYVSED